MDDISHSMAMDDYWAGRDYRSLQAPDMQAYAAGWAEAEAYDERERAADRVASY